MGGVLFAGAPIVRGQLLAVRIVCRRVETPTEMEAALAIREAVFIQEQGVPVDEERDADDAHARHALAWLDGVPVGTARLVVKDGGRGKIGRVAVRREARGRRVGDALMAFLTDEARALGLVELFLDAQVPVIPFYARLGYREEGDLFLDAGIGHRRMRRRL